MKNFKILISPAKTFNNDALSSSKEINTIFLEETKDIFKIINSFNQKDIQEAYKVSEKISKEVIQYNNDWNNKSYKAIELFGGMVFNQLDIKEEDMKWVNEHVLILDALYGVIAPDDYISKYRLDFKTILDIDLKKVWKDKVNNYLKDYKLYSLASKEFTDLLDIEFEGIRTNKDIKQIKKARGIKLNQLIKSKQIL